MAQGLMLRLEEIGPEPDKDLIDESKAWKASVNVIVEQAHVKRADGLAAGANAPRLVQRRVDHRAGFGQAVELDQATAKARLEFRRPGRQRHANAFEREHLQRWHDHQCWHPHRR